MRSAIVETQNLSRIYDGPSGPIRGLDHASLIFRAGEVIAVVGRSGAGKSTLLNVLGCLDRPTSGRYILNGKDVSNLDDDSLAGVRNDTIGFVFQSYRLLPWLTAQENVALPLLYAATSPAERKRRAFEALETVDMADRVEHKPSELSGGQQQRVAIARALVNDPHLLLADEPTGNLDTSTGRSILTLFDQLRGRGMTLVLVTHDPTVADFADRSVCIEDGLVTDQRSAS